MSKELEALERERTRLLDRIAQIEEEQKVIGDEKPFPTARARALLEIASMGDLPRKEAVEIIDALIALRPKPTEREHFLDWERVEGWQFSVCVPKFGEFFVQLDDDHDQMAHTLTARQAERLGRQLLGAAEALRNLEEDQ